jgi:cell division protein FtsQ
MPKKDYQKKQLNNPYFKKKASKKRKKQFLFSFFLLSFVIILFYLLFYSSLFVIKNINIIGNQRIEDYLIEDLVWQISQEEKIFNIKGDNLWLFSKNKLKDEMYLRLDLANITIKKRLFNKLIINVSEREAVFILKNENNYQFRDITACPINSLEVSDYDLNNNPILEKDHISESEFNGCLNLYDNYINDLIKLNDLVNSSYNFSISKFVLNSERYNLTVILDEGPRVYFSRREDFRKQLEKLRLICQEHELESQLTSINYIDVRYGDKAFINYK